MSRPRRRGEDGSAVLLALVGLAMAGLVLVLAVDVTAYLAAAGRAQTAADAAALAAASAAHPRGHLVGEPDGWAETAAERNGATVVACGCTRGRREVEVTVSTPVGALLATRFLARSVRATARATLLPPDRDSQQDPEHPRGAAPPRSHATVLVAPADVTARGTIAAMTENADTVLREALALPPDEPPTTLRLGP